MRIAFAIVCFFIAASIAAAGTISGKVRAEGKTGADEDLTTGKYESRKYKYFERVRYDEWRDFVVYIDQPMPGTSPPSKPLQVIIQKDATFLPHVLPLMVGTTVEWPNHDDIYHNVFSMSEAKPFDLGLYKGDTIKRITFDKPGKVDVFCSIHTKMSCIILVLQNPFFASADKNGNYNISNVPPGVYKLKAWHERMPEQEKEITVPEKGNVSVDFLLTVAGLPKY